jgi:hypothetical protein
MCIAATLPICQRGLETDFVGYSVEEAIDMQKRGKRAAYDGCINGTALSYDSTTATRLLSHFVRDCTTLV